VTVVPIGHDPGRTSAPPPLRWPLAVALVGVLAAAVVGVMIADLRAPPPDAAATPLFASTLSSAADAPDDAPRRRSSFATALVTSATPLSPASSGARPAAGEVEVCGLGFVARSEADPFGAAHLSSAIRLDAHRRLRAAMQGSADERVRAVGWLFAAWNRGDDAAWNAEGGEDGVEQLARIAMRSQDPFVYGLAELACRRPGRAPAPACQMIGAEQWSRIDARNAVPWLQRAADARARGDAAAEAEAMYRASIATKSDTHWGAVPSLVAQALPADMPLAGRTVVIAEAWLLQSLVAPFDLYRVMPYCSAEAVRDGNRLQVCDALARVLVDHGRSALDGTIGRRIGELAGWPPARIDALREERQAVLDAAAAYVGSRGLSCSGVERSIRWARMTAAYGETGAARELLSTLGPADDGARRVAASDAPTPR